MTASKVWQSNQKLQNYFNRVWYPHHKENLQSYKCCMAVVNEGGAHWVLLKRYQSGIESCKPSTWTVSTEPHAKQQDGTSCGVYVLKFAENYVVKGSIGLEPLNVDKERKNIGRRLISSASLYTTENAHPSPIFPRSSRPTLTQDSTIESSTIFPRKSSRPPQRKRKRSSFVYSTPKKQTRAIHCICRKPNDGRKYWCCDGCNSWYHPACVGKTEDEEEKEFFCPYCTETDIDVEVIGSDEDVPKAQAHDSNRINGKTALEKYQVAVHHLKEVLECVDFRCDEVGHQRHHQFVQNPFGTVQEQKKKFSFGSYYLSQSVMEVITEKLVQDLLYRVPDKKNPATSLPSMMIRHVPANSDLWNLLIENKLLAMNYILYVLSKEVLILIASEHSGAPYEKCQERCQSTEVDSKVLFGI